MRSDKKKKDTNGFASENMTAGYHPGGDPLHKRVPLASFFIGKEIQAEKTWEVPKGWRLVIQTEAVLFFAAMLAVIIGDIADLDRSFMVPAIIAAVLIAVTAAGTMAACIVHMNKTDRIDVHSYDINYMENRLTGETRNNTREIRKED